MAGLVNDAPTNYNFYGPNGYSSIYAVVGRNADGQDVVVDLEDDYYAIDFSQVGTYNLRSVDEAWATLLAGGGYIVNPRNVSEGVITSVELVYYESHEEQEYMLPIYVFKGLNGLVAYVSALHPNMFQY